MTLVIDRGDYSLIAGINCHDSERLFVGSNLEGAETAKVGFSGWFLSPSVRLS